MKTRLCTRIAVLVSVLVFLLSWGGSVSQAATTGREPISLKVALLPFLSFAPFFIAIQEGYFAEQGLEIEFIRFKTDGEHLVPLSQGMIDVAGGAVTAGFFNAVARGMNLQIVADKGHVRKGGGYTGMLVQKDLWEKGELVTLADLEGRKVALGNVGGSSQYNLELVLKSIGMKLEDIETVYMGLPDMVEALKRGAIDAAVTGEPLLTRAEELGAGVRFKPFQQALPTRQIGVVYFGPNLLEKRPDIGKKFMLVYLKAVRIYNQGKTSRNLEVIAKYTKLDQQVLKKCIWPSINSDGHVLMGRIMDMQDWLYEKGFVDNKVKPEEMIDTSFIDWANEELSGE